MYGCFTLGFPRSPKMDVQHQWSTPFIHSTAYAKEQEFSLDLPSLAKAQDSLERVLLKTFVPCIEESAGELEKNVAL